MMKSGKASNVLMRHMMKTVKCRCGFVEASNEPHPCHSKGYTCRKPAKQHFYIPHWNFSVAGAQMKASVSDTWACDECWKEFEALLVK